MIDRCPLILHESFSHNMDYILDGNKVDEIGIAVSGGADSMSLWYLARNWCKDRNIKITIFYVNHNLRTKAKLEISYIKNLSKTLGDKFVLLSWDKGDSDSAIQERARKARYELISKKCKKLGISLLLTGHHIDDMLETYLMRKSRKSSNIALMCNKTYFWDDLWIVRPLFNIEKKNLVQYLKINKIKWFEDDSNKLDKYERNRVRKTLRRVDKKEKLKIVGEFREAIIKGREVNEFFIEALAELVIINNYGFAKINLGKFVNLTEEMKIQLLNYVLGTVNGKNLPRYRNLAKILSAINSGSFNSCTLNYCKLVKKYNEIVVYKERAFINNKNLLWWDNRFKVTIDDFGRNEYDVSALTMEEYVNLKKDLFLEDLAKESNNNHKPILFTLPVIKNLEKVVAIPHISYYDKVLFKNNNIEIIFKPKFISRFTHFF